MRTLVGIQGHAGDREAIQANSESWRNAGCDMIGLEGQDSPVPSWPNWFKGHLRFPIREGKSLGYGLRPTLQLDCIAGLAAFACAFGYEAILWTEADSIFIKPVPPAPVGLAAVIAGYCPPEWNCGNGPFLHPPLLMKIPMAYVLINRGEQLIEKGNGAPDVILGMVMATEKLPIKPLLDCYSCNGLDMRVKGKMMEARSAAQAGAWHIHGIKRQDHQDFILGKTDQFPVDSL